MEISAAQREMRTVYLGGFAGQLVSGLIWLLSAALATWVRPNLGILVLVVFGFFTFPLTQLVLRLMGRRATLSKTNSLNELAIQVAFTLPLNLLLVGAATLYKLNWFYPAFMIALGTHYLPFVFQYGMRMFYVLAGLLIVGGWIIAQYFPASFSLGGWLTGAILLAFAFIGRTVLEREIASPVQA